MTEHTRVIVLVPFFSLPGKSPRKGQISQTCSRCGTLMLGAASFTTTVFCPIQKHSPPPRSLLHCQAPQHEVERAHLSTRLWTALQRHPEAAILPPTWALDTAQGLSSTRHAQELMVSAGSLVFPRMPFCEHMAELPNCPQTPNLICGTDGLTYENECHLCLTRMKTMKDIQIMKDGQC
uniref:Kazal-like domain-containing protein n=1 Tax=Mus spicilegus TaxID=10103 RepID=A0A8C6GL89_MUSSI